MSDGLTIEFETREVDRGLSKLLNLVEKPKKLLKNLQRYIHAVTMQMFRGIRPDTRVTRGVKWKKLEKSTIAQKKNLLKRGLLSGSSPHRPMVRTGETRDSLKVLGEKEKGFEYGTRKKSKKGFPFPGYHNSNNFPFLFLTKFDFAQGSKMVTDYLGEVMKGYKHYVKKR